MGVLHRVKACIQYLQLGALVQTNWKSCEQIPFDIQLLRLERELMLSGSIIISLFSRFKGWKLTRAVAPSEVSKLFGDSQLLPTLSFCRVNEGSHSLSTLCHHGKSRDQPSPAAKQGLSPPRALSLLRSQWRRSLRKHGYKK